MNNIMLFKSTDKNWYRAKVTDIGMRFLTHWYENIDEVVFYLLRNNYVLGGMHELRDGRWFGNSDETLIFKGSLEELYETLPEEFI